jgi:phosphohistidine phosphatase SixA
MKFLFASIILMLLATSCSHTYYIVRHAEKTQAAGDPPLSAAGKQRAEKLKQLLDEKKIRYIFSTNTDRTISTAKPLSEATGVKIELYDPRKDSAFIVLLKGLRKNALIVGHSNTIDDIVNKLCNAVKVPADINDAVYDNLFIVRYRGKKIFFQQKKY